jgi:hypothetical protein
MSNRSTTPEGLPHGLPTGETLLWQGKPDFRRLLMDAFRLRMLSVYVGVIVLWSVASAAFAGYDPREILASAVWAIGLGALALALIMLMAWLTARSTIYTITSRRVVIAHGASIRKHLNLPFAKIEAAGIRINDQGFGDIPLTLDARTRLSYILLWPHVKAGKKAGVEPMLRAVPDAGSVAKLLADAWAAHQGEAANLLRRDQATPMRAKQTALGQAHAA